MMLTTKNTIHNISFLQDTLKGLQAEPKYMHSKYFYDERGDRIFQQIMAMDEYYLTDAEMEIMQFQALQIADLIAEKQPFDLIELGAGDATKSVHLLQALINQSAQFTYYPIDISTHVIADLQESLPRQIPTLDFEGLNGDYFDMLEKVTEKSSRRKVVLFMGANIGNMNRADARDFCRQLKGCLAQGDLLIIGFDLKKNPKQILAAYNDPAGITSAFNLNLLRRMNVELNANFNQENFEHYATYDPESGECKSYLISLCAQTVQMGTAKISFAKDEHIYMEISQKYAHADIEELARLSGFKVQDYFTDDRQYFVDAVWKIDQ